MPADQTLSRCAWVPEGDALYCAYHDTEWGVPEYDSRALWEKLILDGMQAGLACASACLRAAMCASSTAGLYGSAAP